MGPIDLPVDVRIDIEQYQAPPVACVFGTPGRLTVCVP